MTTPDRAGHFAVDGAAGARGNRAWWDAQAIDYLAEHGEFLGDAELVWGPEGWTEEDLGLLGAVTGRRVLEVGAGAAQGARWCRRNGADVVATDVSFGMLATARPLDTRSGVSLPLVQCDASELPFADASFDIVFTAYGAVPFIADTAALMREFARVLRPGGRLAFTTTHPIRWAFPDVPGEAGLTAIRSYFDTTPYAEASGATVMYAEHHRTLEARVTELLDAGLELRALRELPWRPDNPTTWGGWSPLRGERIPGTLALVGDKPVTAAESAPSAAH